MEHTFKLFEFNIYNDKNTDLSSDGSDDNDTDIGKHINRDKATFAIQMFGINEEGQKASITVEEYQPFFYVKVPNEWGQKMKVAFRNVSLSSEESYMSLMPASYIASSR